MAAKAPASPTIIDACLSPLLFRGWFKDIRTWKGALSYFRTLYSLPKSAEDLAIARACTGLAEFPSTPVKESCLTAPRRIGKSSMLGLEGSWVAISRDWSRLVAPGEKAFIFIVATDKVQAAQIKNYISGLFSLTPTLRSMVVRETRETIELRTGCIISVKPCSFRSLRGYSCAAVFLDEAAFFRNDESANPDRELVVSARPALVNLNGILRVSGSPYMKMGIMFETNRNWYGRPGGPLVWKVTDARLMNPTISEETIRRAIEEDPQAARSEWLGEFREDLEQIFSLDMIERLVVPGRGDLPPVKGFRYHGFVDPSGGRSDSFTLGIAHRSRSGRLVLDVLKEAKPPFRPEDVVAEYAQALRSFGVAEATADAYAGEWVSAAFEKHGIADQRQVLFPSDDNYFSRSWSS